MACGRSIIENLQTTGINQWIGKLQINLHNHQFRIKTPNHKILDKWFLESFRFRYFPMIGAAADTDLIQILKNLPLCNKLTRFYEKNFLF